MLKSGSSTTIARWYIGYTNSYTKLPVLETNVGRAFGYGLVVSCALLE
jgi:hypothetical protein